jgi:hypothetical protein
MPFATALLVVVAACLALPLPYCMHTMAAACLAMLAIIDLCIYVIGVE